MEMPHVEKMLNPTVLEVNLIADHEGPGEVGLRNENFRFKAYRTIFFWLFKGIRPPPADGCR